MDNEKDYLVINVFSPYYQYYDKDNETFIELHDKHAMVLRAVVRAHADGFHIAMKTLNTNNEEFVTIEARNTEPHSIDNFINESHDELIITVFKTLKVLVTLFGVSNASISVTEQSLLFQDEVNSQLSIAMLVIKSFALLYNLHIRDDDKIQILKEAGVID